MPVGYGSYQWHHYLIHLVQALEDIDRYFS